MGFMMKNIILIMVTALGVGGKLKYFDTDSQGGRGYCCDKCKYFTWVSYYFVDKIYKK